MTEKTKKKKVATSAVALATAATLLLGGTLAWQSISQEATNVVAAEVNPGGRLHDDFDGSNDKNIYVENFGTQNIYARIKLSEYLEVGQNAGKSFDVAAEDREHIDIYAGAWDEDDGSIRYDTYYYGEDYNSTDVYWTKNWGGGTKYIPTFNKNQDSLEADLNGTYEYINDADESDPYGDFIDINATYNVGDAVEGDEIVDADTNGEDEGAGAAEGENITTTPGVQHSVAQSINGTVISMAEYNELTVEEKAALQAWVYDSDGWAYWSQAIAPETSTGLLLDSITDLGLIDEDYYYAIHVTGQFITAGDIRNGQYNGFYADPLEEPSEDALALLESIGVKVDVEEEGDGGDEDEDPYGFHHMLISAKANEGNNNEFIENAYAKPGETLVFGVVAYYNNGETIPINTENTEWTVEAVEGELDSGTTIENGTLKISENQKIPSVLQYKVTYTDLEGNKYDESQYVLVNDTDIIITAKIEEAVTYYTGIPYEVTATATDVDGDPIPMIWTYDTFATDESLRGEINAKFDENSFVADDAGEFTINVWPEYMFGNEVSIDITVKQNPDEEGQSGNIIFEDDYALIGSNKTKNVSVSLLVNDETVEDVTWEVSSDNAEVVGGNLQAVDSVSMTAPIECYTITAYVGDEEVASAEFYMYNEDQHRLEGVYKFDNSYCLFAHTTATYIPAPEAEVCVWIYGDDVKTINKYTITGNHTVEDMAEIIDNYVNSEDVGNNITNVETCAHISAE